MRTDHRVPWRDLVVAAGIAALAKYARGRTGAPTPATGYIEPARHTCLCSTLDQRAWCGGCAAGAPHPFEGYIDPDPCPVGGVERQRAILDRVTPEGRWW